MTQIYRVAYNTSKRELLLKIRQKSRESQFRGERKRLLGTADFISTHIAPKNDEVWSIYQQAQKMEKFYSRLSSATEIPRAFLFTIGCLPAVLSSLLYIPLLGAKIKIGGDISENCAEALSIANGLAGLTVASLLIGATLKLSSNVYISKANAAEEVQDVINRLGYRPLNPFK